MDLVKSILEFFYHLWVNYWYSVYERITDITSPAFAWLILVIMLEIYEIYRRFFLEKE